MPCRTACGPHPAGARESRLARARLAARRRNFPRPRKIPAVAEQHRIVETLGLGFQFAVHDAGLWVEVIVAELVVVAIDGRPDEIVTLRLQHRPHDAERGAGAGRSRGSASRSYRPPSRRLHSGQTGGKCPRLRSESAGCAQRRTPEPKRWPWGRCRWHRLGTRGPPDSKRRALSQCRIPGLVAGAWKSSNREASDPEMGVDQNFQSCRRRNRRLVPSPASVDS